MKPVLMDQEMLYVPKCDRDLPEEEQTKFILKPIGARDAASLQDNATETHLAGKDGDTVMRMKSGSQALKALSLGVKGWMDFKGPDGNDIPWRENAGKPHPDVFDCIPASVRQELANVIIDGCEISEETEKN